MIPGFPINIIVNGKGRPLHAQDAISYSDVLFMAGMHRAEGLITVTYRNAAEDKPDGILAPGEHIMVKEGTAFSAQDTSNT